MPKFIGYGSELLQFLCSKAGKWGIMVSAPYTISSNMEDENIYESKEAAPWLPDEFLFDGGIALFDTEEEMLDHYDQVVGDDGPTEKNPYKGPWKVFALTCDPKGQLRNENT